MVTFSVNGHSEKLGFWLSCSEKSLRDGDGGHGV